MFVVAIYISSLDIQMTFPVFFFDNCLWLLYFPYDLFVVSGLFLNSKPNFPPFFKKRKKKRLCFSVVGKNCIFGNTKKVKRRYFWVTFCFIGYINVLWWPELTNPGSHLPSPYVCRGQWGWIHRAAWAMWGAELVLVRDRGFLFALSSILGC